MRYGIIFEDLKTIGNNTRLFRQMHRFYLIMVGGIHGKIEGNV